MILVEGKDEEKFIEEIIRSIEVNAAVDIREVGGKDQFKSKLGVLTKSTDWSRVTKLGIIRDADEDYIATLQSIRDALAAANLPVPGNRLQFTDDSRPRVGIFIMPDNANAGMLEDLCLRSVSAENLFRCVENFWDCISRNGQVPNNKSKSQIHTYLSAMLEPCPQIGIAAKKGYWDFEAPEFMDLVNFIRDFLTEH